MDTAPLIAELREHVPDLLIGDVQTILDGWDSIVLEIDGEHIVRFARRRDIERQYEKELRLLPELAPALSVAVPRFTIVGRDERSVRFVGYRKIGGVALVEVLPSADNPARLAGDCARFLSELHRFPTKRAVRLGVHGGDAAQWQGRYRRFYEDIRDRIFPLLDAPVIGRTEQMWEGFLDEEANFAFRPALVHADLAPEHILCDARRERIVGVIDWGDAQVGDPALDFVGLLSDCGSEFTERVLVGYEGEVDRTFRRRMSFYERLIPFHEIVFALTTGDEAHLTSGLDALRREFS